jgi:rhodanese-related sulfurtransferase
MIPPMLARPRHHLTAAGAALVGVLAAAWLATGRPADADRPHFREVSAPEGARLLATPGAVLVEVLTPLHGVRGVARSTLAFADGPLPPALWPEGRPAASAVLLASEPAAGYRMAARLARAGIERVVVVRGGIEAWHGLSHLGAEADTAERGGAGKPDGPAAAAQRPEPTDQRGERSDGKGRTG